MNKTTKVDDRKLPATADRDLARARIAGCDCAKMAISVAAPEHVTVADPFPGDWDYFDEIKLDRDDRSVVDAFVKAYRETLREFVEGEDSAYEKWMALFTSSADAVAFEERVLSVGRELLPPCAHEVLDGELFPSADYWRFLSGQFLEMQRDQSFDAAGEA